MTEADLLNIFRDEVSGYLETLNSSLMAIETGATDPEALRELNRVAHSMKGAARAVGFKVVETIAHYMEDVFAAAREARVTLAPDVCDLLYDGLDLIQTAVDGDDVGQEVLAEVLVRLEQIVAGGAAFETPLPPAPDPTPPAPDDADVEVVVSNDVQTLTLRPLEDSIRVPVSKLDRLMAEASELLVARLQAEERTEALRELRLLHRRWRREWQHVRGAYIRLSRRLDADEHNDLLTVLRFLESNQRHLGDANRQLTALAADLGSDNLRLTMLAEQLQAEISGLRLVAFDTMLGAFQRMVRDLARDTHKQILLDMTGTSIELDKNVLDALKDPLMHLLRNAIDHGIEAADARRAAGKSPTGRIYLGVEQRGSEIVLRIGDDGRGIDPDHLRARAVRNGLLTSAEAEALSEDEARALIFQPGFTTSDRITAISGRGIGLDVVRDRVESLRGRIHINSTPGSGTIVSLTVPVSLTRIRCVLLRAGDEHYAIPSTVIQRMTHLPRESIFTAEGRELITIDEHPVPLVALGAMLGVPISERGDWLTVLVLHAADRTVAFEVDELLSERDVVLKQLGREIAGAHYVAGAALLGTGAVLIVLDANNLVRGATGAAIPIRQTQMHIDQPTAGRALRVLVVDDSITTRTLEKNILETAGFDVTIAIDGVEGWRIINEAAFDVVISDVEMPRMDGLELTRTIKTSPHTRHIPVILLTSLGRLEQQEAGLKAGADAYLIKSQFDQGELMRAIWDVV